MRRPKQFCLAACLLLLGLCVSCVPRQCVVPPAAPWAPCFSPQPVAVVSPAPQLDIKLFITNDVHGYALADPGKGRIGYALLAAQINAARAAGHEVYLMDAGDAFGGSAYAQFDSGRSIADIMRRMNYRVVSPGNHAFDFNIPENNLLHYASLLERAGGGEQMAATSLNLSKDGQDFPGVRSNPIIVRDNGDGFRLVVAGLLTPYTGMKASRNGLFGFDFGMRYSNGQPDHEATKQALLALVENRLEPYSQPGDIVLVLSHVGYDETEDYADGQVSGRDVALVRNVDIVADSHSHTRALPRRIGNAWYVSGSRYLEDYVEITITGTADAPEISVETRTWDTLAVTEPDPAMSGFIGEISARLGMDEALFMVDDEKLLNDAGVSYTSIPLGRMLCHALRRISGADLSLYNSGGIRSGIGKGQATVGTIYNVMPFVNNLVTYKMTGQDILDMFNSLPAAGTNGFPQFHGMTVYAWLNDNNTLGIAGILDSNGAPLRPDQEYLVAMNSFMAGDGDGFTFTHQGQIMDFGDSTTRLVKHFRSVEQPDLEQYRDNSALPQFQNREEAESAWERATGTARDESVRPAA